MDAKTTKRATKRATKQAKAEAKALRKKLPKRGVSKGTHRFVVFTAFVCGATSGFIAGLIAIDGLPSRKTVLEWLEDVEPGNPRSPRLRGVQLDEPDPDQETAEPEDDTQP